MTWKTFSLLIFLCVASSLSADDPQEELIQSRFATSPNITAPTGLSVSPQGVAFVSSDINGVTNKKRKVGRVIRCEDTNGDGKADQFTNFVDEIDSPRGSCFVHNTLFLMQPPLLVAYQDQDADGVAEKKTTLVTNLGPGLRAGGVIHGANGVQMGIDGWLYLAIGDQGCRNATGTDGSRATLRGGGLLRVRPDGSQLEVIVRGTRNIYDVAIDPYLDIFALDNTNDGGKWGSRLHHLTELANFGYPNLFLNFEHESMDSLADFGAGAGTSMLSLHEPGFPVNLSNSLLAGDYNDGVFRISCERVKASFRVKREPFLKTSMNIGMDVDGLSRLYFASREGGGFGYAQKPFGHIDIVQAKKQSTRQAFPNIKKSSVNDLLNYLANPSHVLRITAMREFVTRGANSDISNGLLRLAKDTEAELYSRAAAIMTLKQLDGNKSHPALKGLYESEKVREFVVRAVGDVADEFDSISESICLKALNDDDPRVQLRAIIGLARSGKKKFATSILPLASAERMNERISTSVLKAEKPSSTPRVIPHTALKAVIKLQPIELLLEKLNDTNLRETALRALQEIHSEKVVMGLSAKVDSTSDKQLAKLIALALFRLYHRESAWDGESWWRNRPNFQGPYFQCSKWKFTPAIKLAIESAFKKVAAKDYGYLFVQMRLNQVPATELNLDIQYDEAMNLLTKSTLSNEEYNFVMKAAADEQRSEKDRLQIYNYFKRSPIGESYLNRVQILRKWGEGRAKEKLLRTAYQEFVSGKEFVGKVEQLATFLANSEHDCYKYAHIQLINLINDKSTPKSTRLAAESELEKTWADKKNIYPHRLRGLMLAFSEVDPTPYAAKLKPLVDHRDERTKQGAAKYLQAIQSQTK